MSGVDTHRGERHQLTVRKRQWRPTLRDEIRAAWSMIDETRGIRHDQLDGMEEVLNWLFRAARREGTPDRPATAILRSIPQIVGPDGLNWEKMPTMRATQKRYRNQVLRRLEYAQRIGWVESVKPEYKANGMGRGILIRLTPAGVAQSVAAALPKLRDRGASRTARRASQCSSSSGQVSAPLRESGVCEDQKRAGNSTSDTRRPPVARARRREGSKNGPAPRAAISVPLASGGALAAPRAQGTERTGLVGERGAIREASRGQLRSGAVGRVLASWGIPAPTGDSPDDGDDSEADPA